MFNDTIWILVNGEPHQTVMVDGVQRFRVNKVIKYIIDTQMINLNQLWAHYRKEDNDMMAFYMAMGYSVDGFCNIFEDVEILNPLWEVE